MEERQSKYRRGGHAVGEQPEEQVFVTQETIAGKGIGCRQRHGDRKQGIDHHVDDRIDVTVIPGRIGEDDLVIRQGKFLGKKGETAEDLVGRLEGHGEQSVDRQHQKQDIERGYQPFI